MVFYFLFPGWVDDAGQVFIVFIEILLYLNEYFDQLRVLLLPLPLENISDHLRDVLADIALLLEVLVHFDQLDGLRNLRLKPDQVHFRGGQHLIGGEELHDLQERLDFGLLFVLVGEVLALLLCGLLESLSNFNALLFLFSEHILQFIIVFVAHGCIQDIAAYGRHCVNGFDEVVSLHHLVVVFVGNWAIERVKGL